MEKPRVYIDTSVFGGCFEPEFEIWSNGLMDDFKNGIYSPVVSQVVANEISKAPSFVKAKYAELSIYNLEILPLTNEVYSLAETYKLKQILSPKYFEDLLHIAIATINNIDILVSWNFKHIVHFEKIKLFNAVNLELSYKTINIFSPREVTTYEKEN
ncbi:MAG: type II toxin-antitoxin system VapC family toxin [Bacteroidota bacterium]|nr:type II toxin-antitoxin system VapC family toxin [Bacteroidota bacterium]